MAARKQLPHGRAPVQRWRPSPATGAGLQRALHALHGTAQPIVGDEALALREQFRRDEQVRQLDLLKDRGA